MSELNIKNAIEAVLFASGSSVPVSRIATALEISEKEAKKQLDALMNEYTGADRGITIVRLDDAYQMVSRDEYAPQIRTVMDLRRNTPLSQAAMEVLAVVAYNQPVTKAFIEQIRGVDCSAVLSNLCQKSLVEEVGRLELPGRPLIYGTTAEFLRCFNVSSIAELPELPREKTEEHEENDDEIEKNSADDGTDFQLEVDEKQNLM